MKKFDDVVQELLAMFERQDFPEQVALTIIRKKQGGDLPSDKWSITNRIIMHVIGDTEDARGYKQWQSVGRQVKQGSKAFNIIAPLTKKSHNDETGEDEVIVYGYRSVRYSVLKIPTERKCLPSIIRPKSYRHFWM